MGLISGKILSALLSASIVSTAIGYTGGQYLDTVKSNIESVTLKAVLLNDEALTKIDMANELLKEKNRDILRLKEELDSRTSQLNAANGKIDQLEQERTDKSKEVSNTEADLPKSDTDQEITESNEVSQPQEPDPTQEGAPEKELQANQQENKDKSKETGESGLYGK